MTLVLGYQFNNLSRHGFHLWKPPRILCDLVLPSSPPSRTSAHPLTTTKMCLWRELWYTVCGHYSIILEPCKAAKKAQAKGTEITRGRSWPLTFFGKKDNTTIIAEAMPIEKLTKITYNGDELVLTPTCDYTTPERVELVADLCPECIHTFELCKIDHAYAQQYVRDWRNTNDFGLEYGPLTFVEANGGLTIKKNPVDNYDRGSNEKFYTHRASKPNKQDRQDYERVSEETVARRTRRHDQEDEEQAEKHARSVARYEKKLIFKMHDQETRENTIANTGVRVEQVLRPRRNSEVFKADPERDAADRQAYTRMPRGDCCPETFVNLELEHEPEDPIQQERYIQDEAARQIKKMAIEGDYNSAAKDAEAYKKAQATAVEAKLKEKLKSKHIKEEALRKQKERAVQQEATISANVGPRGRSDTNFNVSNSTFGLNVIGRRPSVPAPQQSRSQWPQQRQGPPRNVTLENESRRPSDARRLSVPAPPQSQSEWPGQRRPVPNRTGTFEVQRRERRPTDTSVQRPNPQPLRANPPPQRPVPTPMRNNTVFPGAKDFPSAVKSSSKPYRKSKHTAIDAYGDAYGPGSYDSNSSGEWAENDPEGIQLQELAVKASRRQRNQSRAQNYELPTEPTDRDRNFSFSRNDSEDIRPPPAARLPWVPAPAQAQRPGIHGLHTDPEVIAHSRSIFERARQASFARVQRPAWMVDECAADYNVEAQNTSFGSYGSQCPIMGSPEQMAVQDDSPVFVVGDEEQNETSRTPVRATFHDEAALSRSPIQISRSPIQISRSSIQISRSPIQVPQTPAHPAGSFTRPQHSPGLDVYGACVTDDSLGAYGITNDFFGSSRPAHQEGNFSHPQYSPGLDVYGVTDDSLGAISRSPIQLLQTPGRPEDRFSRQPEYVGLDVYGAGVIDDAYGSSRSTRPEGSFSRPHYSPSSDVYGASITHDSSAAYGVSDNHDSSRSIWDRRPPPPNDGDFVMSPQGEDNGRGKMPYKVV